MKHSNKFNMHGYLIEFNPASMSWKWNKWEYRDGLDYKRSVIRKTGTLEFMKMFPEVFIGAAGKNSFSSHEEMDRSLERKGVKFIFLYQGKTVEEGFRSIEEAESHYELDSLPVWNLTDYWFGYDEHLSSWAMFDTFTGRCEFTPRQASERMAASVSNDAGWGMFNTQKPTGYTIH